MAVLIALTLGKWYHSPQICVHLLTTHSQSEWISLKNAPQIIASCFKAPFSGPVESIQPIEDGEEVEEITPKRKVVFVGHDTLTDVRYLRDLGYNVLNIPPHELIDTAEMYRWLRRETSNRNLGSVLADLGIAGWNLHNVSIS